jgi:hypothetical protein
MKKIVLAALAATTAIIATPAAAQTVTGTVNVTGSVANRCSVVLPGGASSATFTGTIGLGALDDPDGTLRDNLQASTTASPADGLHVLTRVVCNTAAPVVTISATAMQIAGGTLTGATGYSDTVHYTAQVGVTDTASAVQFRRYNTLLAAAPAGSVATGALTLPISAAPGNNVDVSVFNMHSEGADTNILAAGSYLGVVTVTVSPT